MEVIHNEGLEDYCPTCKDRRSHHPNKVKSDLTIRLNRIEGQIRDVRGLIEKNTYCGDHNLNQIAAIQAALNGVPKVLLTGHIKDCVVERIQDGDNEAVDELLKTIQKLMK
ncbi:MAG: csoR 1 [Paenibacillus sp.]|jgi:DNA-binding FrmR family transcriptional regulator|nr:csoR 1 [Paenibacillus sp.]